MLSRHFSRSPCSQIKLMIFSYLYFFFFFFWFVFNSLLTVGLKFLRSVRAEIVLHYQVQMGQSNPPSPREIALAPCWEHFFTSDSLFVSKLSLQAETGPVCRYWTHTFIPDVNAHSILPQKLAGTQWRQSLTGVIEIPCVCVRKIMCGACNAISVHWQHEIYLWNTTHQVF